MERNKLARVVFEQQAREDHIQLRADHEGHETKLVKVVVFFRGHEREAE